MRGFGLTVALVIAPAAVLAGGGRQERESDARLSVGLGVVARSVGASFGADGVPVRSFETAGIGAVSFAGELYPGSIGALALGFFLSYTHVPEFTTTISRSTGVDSTATQWDLSRLGAVGRYPLGPGLWLRSRLGIGHSRLTFTEVLPGDVRLGRLPDSTVRYLRVSSGVDKRLGIVGLSGAVAVGRAFDLDGAPSTAMDETGGNLFGADAAVGLVIDPFVDLRLSAGIDWLIAGDWIERQSRIELAWVMHL